MKRGGSVLIHRYCVIFRAKMRIPFSAFVLTAALVVAAPLVWTQGAAGTVARSPGMSMDQAVKMVEQRFKARVVRAESQRNGDHTIYVLRMLNESGRVWTVRVDASSGSVL